MSFISMKPGTLLSPAPVVMVTCAGEGIAPNIITIAWTGTVNSTPPMVSISVQPIRFSHNIIKNSGEFVINLVSRQLMQACDFCGVKSGRDTDKFAQCSLSPVPARGMDYAPAIQQSPAYLACKVRQSLSLGSHTMFIGEIVSMGIQQQLIDADGKIDFIQADLVAYCHGEYMGLRKPEGFFGYSIARPEVLKRRLNTRKR